jgi:glutaredoxin
MKSLLCSMALVALWSAFPQQASAQFYQYTDDRGNVFISDRPPQGRDAKEKRLRDDGISWSSRGEADIPAPGNGKPPAGDTKRMPENLSGVTVVMYRTSWCGYCKQAASYVRSLGARLVEYDIDKDPDRKAEMRRKSGGSAGVPLLDIDGTIVRGYSPQAIKAAMEASAGR